MDKDRAEILLRKYMLSELMELIKLTYDEYYSKLNANPYRREYHKYKEYNNKLLLDTILNLTNKLYYLIYKNSKNCFEFCKGVMISPDVFISKVDEKCVFDHIKANDIYTVILLCGISTTYTIFYQNYINRKSLYSNVIHGGNRYKHELFNIDYDFHHSDYIKLIFDLKMDVSRININWIYKNINSRGIII